MLQKFLREVMNIIVGKQGDEIINLLDDKKYINEFLIAKKLGGTINQTRNILYKLSDYGLVSSIRKKDKRKGWYTYFWKIEILKSLEFLRELLLKKIDQLEHQIKSRETKRFYVCERCNVEYAEENALLHNFTCSECGSVFTVKDNVKLLRDSKRERDNLERQKKLVEEEIQKEKEKLEARRQRELKKESSKAKKIKDKKKKSEGNKAKTPKKAKKLKKKIVKSKSPKKKEPKKKKKAVISSRKKAKIKKRKKKR